MKTIHKIKYFSLLIFFSYVFGVFVLHVYIPCVSKMKTIHKTNNLSHFFYMYQFYLIFLVVFTIQFLCVWPVGRVFAKYPGRVIAKTLKMVLDTSLLNTQLYKLRIKGKVDQSRERSSTLSYTSVLYLLKREPSGRPQLWLPTTPLCVIDLRCLCAISISLGSVRYWEMCPSLCEAHHIKKEQKKKKQKGGKWSLCRNLVPRGQVTKIPSII